MPRPSLHPLDSAARDRYAKNCLALIGAGSDPFGGLTIGSNHTSPSSCRKRPCESREGETGGRTSGGIYLWGNVPLGFGQWALSFLPWPPCEEGTACRPLAYEFFDCSCTWLCHKTPLHRLVQVRCCWKQARLRLPRMRTGIPLVIMPEG